MRVTVDATALLVRSAGVKNYTWHWLRHLRRAARPGEEIRAFPFLGHVGELNHERSALSPVATLARLALVHGVNAAGRFALDALIGGTDVFHAANLLPQVPAKARLTATVHDLTAWLLPQHHTPATARADSRFAQRILRRAHGLIAVSENTRRDAIRLLAIAPEKIRAIHSGVAEEYFDPAPVRRARPYVLFVGTVEPRKNLATLLDAWRSLKLPLKDEFELVVAGPEGWHSAATLARIRAEATYLGYVPESELPGLFAGAAVFVYPSLYEGFGFPVVQAMAAGVPVIASNTSCLPEVTGGAAALTDPRSPAELAAALARLLQSDAERARLIALGRERARAFRWERCAEASLEFFREVCGR